MTQHAILLTEAELEALIDRRIAVASEVPKVEKELLTLNEVSVLLSLSRKTIAKYVREEGMPHSPHGRVNRFSRSAVLAWNEARVKKP